MDMVTRLERWRSLKLLTQEQHASLARQTGRDVISVALELDLLLYGGVLALVSGLGWTLAADAEAFGPLAIVAALTAIIAACLGYCLVRAPAWSAAETASPTPVFDYVLYLGTLVWGLQFGYLEQHFHLLAGQWDIYLLATSILFFVLAYRFDSRLVLSLALSSLAGWLGFSIAHRRLGWDDAYRHSALVFGLVVASMGILSRRYRLKAHFLGTYLNLATNVLLATAVSGVIAAHHDGLWLLCLLLLCGGALLWGIRRRQFAFVVYAALYGYVGVSALLLQSNAFTQTLALVYFFYSAIAMLVGLVVIARRFGGDA